MTDENMAEPAPEDTTKELTDATASTAHETKDTATTTPPKTVTNNKIVQEWLRTSYVQAGLDIASEITIKDFLNITTTAAQDLKNSWFTDDQVTVPLILLAQSYQMPSGILVLTPFAASQLCAIGFGKNPREDFIDRYEESYMALRERDQLRWVVVPCSDGMLNACDESAAARIKESTNRGKKIKRKTSGIGSHWGFMVIDRQTHEARWLDGHLMLKESTSGTKIEHMFLAGEAAGRVLCGYDQIMEHTKGKFKTSTLKHVPHDFRDNSFKGDPGAACGPYIFAMLRYLLQNPTFLTNEHGLKGTFKKYRGRRHMADLGFDSRKTRFDMQKIIAEEASGKETAEELPYKLTPQVLKVLNRPTPEQLWSSLVGLINTEPRPSGDGAPPDDSDSDDDDDDSDYRDTGVPKSLLRAEIRSNPALYNSEDLDREGRYQLAYETLQERQRQVEEQRRKDQGKVDEENNSNDSSNENNNNNGPSNGKPHSEATPFTGKETPRYPEGFGKDNLPDFLSLTSEDTENWRASNPGFFNQQGHNGLSFSTARCVLHSICKGNFQNQPERSLYKCLSDGHAFDRAEQARIWTTQQIADRLDECYLKLEIPLFPTLTNEEVDHWVDRLHPDARKAIGDVSDPEYYLRARGLLYRMFVGEIDDMSAEVVEQWRANDPAMEPVYRDPTIKTVEEVRRWMKIYYHVPESTTLPFLRNSPLHWPERKYRPRGSPGSGIAPGLPGEGNKRKHSLEGCTEDDDVVSKKLKTSSEPSPKSSDQSGSSSSSDPSKPSDLEGSKKRPHDSEDEDTESGDVVSKKLKTGDLTESGDTETPIDLIVPNVHDATHIASSNPDYGSTTSIPPSDTHEGTQTSDPASDGTVEDPMIDDATIEVYIGRFPCILDPSDPFLFPTLDETRDGWPEGAISFPDFAHLKVRDFLSWRSANPDLTLEATDGRHIPTTSLAKLHLKFKKTFLHEPDENFSAVWINDSTVFSPSLAEQLRQIEDDAIRNGEIRLRMMQAYESQTLDRLQDSGVYNPVLVPVSVPQIMVVGASQSSDDSVAGPVDTSLLTVPKPTRRRR